MRIERWKLLLILLILASAFAFIACENGGDNPYISIQYPTRGSTYTQDCTAVTLAGEVAAAGYVHVRNTTTGDNVEAYVVYGGDGYWEAELTGLALGPNVIVATADQDNTGRVTDNDVITITVTLPQ